MPFTVNSTPTTGPGGHYALVFFSPKWKLFVFLIVFLGLMIGGAVLTTNVFIDSCCCYEDNWNAKTSSCSNCDVCGGDADEADSDLTCQEKHDWRFECASVLETIFFCGFMSLGCGGCCVFGRYFGEEKRNSNDSRNGDGDGETTG